MVDLHHHLLPGTDDGSPDLSTSLEMARIAAGEGITHVVCTPHASSRYAFEPEHNAERLAELRSALQEAGIRLHLGLGCDFHLSYDNVQDALENPRRYTVNATEYLLVELPDYALPPTLQETLYQLRLGGMTPILTHPERNPSLQQNPERLAAWVNDGLLLQVTASSVLGEMGSGPKRLAHRLLADRWVHFLATDAHNATSRPPRMSAACDLVAGKYGAHYAQLLCTENPQSVFDGRPLPAQEPRRNLDVDDPDADDDRPRSLLRRLFKR
jgi:protein-tyrosine phosphatase